jgi:hypothetical protein
VRVLLDEQMPRDLLAELVGHEVRTVSQLGWNGLENGALLAAAAPRFDALITMDKRIPLDRDPTRSTIGLLLIRARSNRIEDLRPLVPAIMEALTHVRPGEVRTVGA